MKKNNIIKTMSILSLLFVGLISCNKESDENSNGKTGLHKIQIPTDGVSIHNLEINNLNLTDKQKTMALEVLGNTSKRHIAVFCSSLFGSYQSKSFKVNGNFMNDIELNIANFHIKGDDYPNNMVSFRNDGLKQIYGTENDFTITANNIQSDVLTNYVSNPIQVDPLQTVGGIDLNNNSIITWNVDSENEFPFVVFKYITRNNPVDPMVGETVTKDVLILEDDGSFDLKSIINNPSQKSIQFTMTRGTTNSFEDVLFTMKSTDTHLYSIK